MFFLTTIIQLFLVVWLLVVWKVDSNARVVFTPFAVFVLADMVFSWNYWLLFQELDVHVSYSAVFISMAAVFCVGLGYVLSAEYERTVFSRPYPRIQLSAFLDAPLRLYENRFVYPAIKGVLLIVGISAGIAYFRGVPPTTGALIKLLSGSELVEAQQMLSSGRRELTKSYVFGGQYRGQGVLKSILFASWTYGLSLSLIIALQRRRWRRLMMVLIFFAGAVYSIGGTGERSRILWSLVVAIIAVSYVIRFDLKRLTSAGLFLGLMLVLLTFMMPRYDIGKSKSELFYNLSSSIAHRIFSGDKINNVRIMNLIDTGYLDFAYGKEHLDIIDNVLPGVPSPLLAHRIAELLKGKTTTYASGTYLGTVYFDFGVFGVLLVYLMLGIFIHQVFRRVLMIVKRPENLVLIAFTGYALGNMSARAGMVSLVSNFLPILAVHGLVMVTIACVNTIQGLSIAEPGTSAVRGTLD